jgi:hypothetical protein
MAKKEWRCQFSESIEEDHVSYEWCGLSKGTKDTSCGGVKEERDHCPFWQIVEAINRLQKQRR